MNVDFMEHELQNFSTIIHCAAIVSYSKNRQEEMFEVNVRETKQLIDMALTSDIDYFLHLSSVAAIGRSDKAKVVDETNDWVSTKLSTSYGESKYLVLK